MNAKLDQLVEKLDSLSTNIAAEIKKKLDNVKSTVLQVVSDKFTGTNDNV